MVASARVGEAKSASTSEHAADEHHLPKRTILRLFTLLLVGRLEGRSTAAVGMFSYAENL
jgi:hypothetical protein